MILLLLILLGALLIKAITGMKYRKSFFIIELPEYKVPSLMLVRYAFNNAGGIASAIAVIMIILCFAFAITINWLFKERDPYGKK